MLFSNSLLSCPARTSIAASPDHTRLNKATPQSMRSYFPSCRIIRLGRICHQSMTMKWLFQNIDGVRSRCSLRVAYAGCIQKLKATHALQDDVSDVLGVENASTTRYEELQLHTRLSQIVIRFLIVLPQNFPRRAVRMLHPSQCLARESPKYMESSNYLSMLAVLHYPSLLSSSSFI